MSDVATYGLTFLTEGSTVTEISDFFITYFLVRTLDVLISDEETETSYKDYMESEFIESVIEKAEDYLENSQ